MLQSKIVFLKITLMFLVMVAGWWASRRRYLTPALTKALSVLVVQLAFPSLVFAQMLETVSLSALKRGWWIPVFALGSIILAAWVGKGLAGLFRVAPTSRRTFVLLVAMPNWVFLPLPIAGGLYGAEGIRFVLLYNLGAQIILWTYGVHLIQEKGGEKVAVWRMLLGNVGIMATIGGAALALCWPGLTAPGDGLIGAGWRLMVNGGLGALKMIGDLTIPLSLLVAGAQLGELVGSSQFQWRPLIGVNLGRLVVAPLLTISVLVGVAHLLGVRLTEVELITSVVIVSMPAAITCSMLVENYNGDRGLSASGIFLSTLLSLLTVPVAVWCCHWLL
ncbi:MAG: AEC family transporter [bacterium]